MSSSIEIIFNILPGYWILTRLNVTKYNALRDSGYHILFKSTIVGGILYFFLLLIVKPNFPLVPPEVFSIKLSVEEIVLIFSSVVAFFIPLIGNIFYNDDKATKRAAKLNSDVIELLIIESLENQTPVELSLSNDKCYVGYVLNTQASRQRESDIALVPIASGYRDKESRELVLTTNYTSVIANFITKKPDSHKFVDFRIVIRMSEILSARFFDLEIYEYFQNID